MGILQKVELDLNDWFHDQKKWAKREDDRNRIVIIGIRTLQIASETKSCTSTLISLVTVATFVANFILYPTKLPDRTTKAIACAMHKVRNQHNKTRY